MNDISDDYSVSFRFDNGFWSFQLHSETLTYPTFRDCVLAYFMICHHKTPEEAKRLYNHYVLMEVRHD